MEIDNAIGKRERGEEYTGAKKWFDIKMLVQGIFLFLILCIIQFNINDYNFQFDSKEKKINYFVEYSEVSDSAEGWKIEQKDSELILTSITNDPKLFFCLDEKVEFVYFDISINNISKSNNDIFSTKAEVYYASESQYTGSQKVEFTLKKGHNVIAVPCDNTYTDFRIDLASEKGVTVSLNEIEVTNRLKYSWLIRVILVAFILDLLILAVVYLSQKNIKAEDAINKILMPAKDLYNEFVTYFKNNIAVVGWLILFVVLSYGLLCAYYTIYIDEERQIIESYATQDWIAQSRFGNYIFERFFLVGRVYTSYIGDAVAAILLGISTLIQCFNFYQLSNKTIRRLSQVVYCGIAISVPYVYGAFMVVGIYNIEVSLAICLTNLAVAFIFSIQHSSKIRHLYAIILLAISISIYQAFVPLFITNVVLCCLLWLEFNPNNFALKEVVYNIIMSILICIMALFLYYIVNKLFIMRLGYESDYLSSSFVGWGKDKSVLEIIHIILAHIKKIIIGSPSLLFGGIIYRVTFAGLGLYFIVRLNTSKKNKPFFIFLIVCSIIAPFCMNFALGSTMFAGRTLLGIPSLLGVIWILIIEKLSDKNFIRGLAYGIAFYLVFIQIQYINQYFLADFKRYQQDQILTQEIIADIRDASAGYIQMPVVPVGVYYHEDNGLTTHYELAGSYYTVDGGSIVRIIRFMQSQGYNVDMPTPEQISDSYNYIEDMPSWPVKGSVKNVNGYVIVKLSEPSQQWISSYVLPYQK